MRRFMSLLITFNRVTGGTSEPASREKVASKVPVSSSEML